MARNIKFNNKDGDEVNGELINTPNECPFCHFSIQPIYIRTFCGNEIQVLFKCPREECLNIFIGYYSGGYYQTFRLERTEPYRVKERVFSETIQNISSTFCEIYNQSFIAEEHKLYQICGVGYRKALEFLIKDYLIVNIDDDTKKEGIKRKFLSNVINEDVTNENIRITAELATWIGNDETHYVRKWTDMDIEDLKSLIELTVRWIESEEITKSYKGRMGK